MNESIHEYDNSQFLQYLKDLDLRIRQLEEKIGIGTNPDTNYSFSTELRIDSKESNETSADINFGENWFANLAIIVFAVFFTFFIVKPYEGTNQFLPSGAGVIIATAIIGLSKYWLKSYSIISRSFFGIGFLLFYISFLRLFHFTTSPALDNKLVESVLLFSFSLFVIYISNERKSYYLNLLGIVLCCITSLILNIPIFHFILLAVISAFIVFSFLRLGFEKTLYVVTGVSIIYLSHLIWALNTPIIGQPLSIVTKPVISFYFLLAYFSIFAGGLLIKYAELKDEGLDTVISFTNSIMCFLLFVVFAFLGFREYTITLYLSFFIVSLTIAVLYWTKTQSKYSTYIYAILSFISLTLAILSAIELPNAFIPLIWQSLLVIAFAIWFNSKGLVVSNFGMFLTIFTAYLLLSQSFGVVSLSFGIVALVSARLLNWQKTRLELKTDMMRTVYLMIAFFAIPFTIINSFNSNFIGLSLILLSVVYYILSIYLRNIKYRWMAHFTLLGTIIYVLVFGLSSINSTYQILTLLALTISLVSVSIFLTKMKINSVNNK